MLQSLEKPKTREHEIAYVMVTCEDGFEEITEQIRSLDGVKEVTSTAGQYDIIVKIEVSTTETLRELLILKIRRIPKVRSTTTIVCGHLPSF
jgi:DNA-binding Lrp family transcriptional regulator